MDRKFEYTDIHGTNIGKYKYSPYRKLEIYDLIKGIFEYLSCNHQIHECNHSSFVLLSSEFCQIDYLD